ncbi:MAG: GNAT family N-acetyltransferase [Ignavibacteriaceae bacterium]
MVTLRPLESSDLQDWYNYLSMPVVFENTSWNVQSPNELIHHVWDTSAYTPSSSLRFAIALRKTNELIGTAGFHTVMPQNKSAELAYDLSPTMWGKGIATSICTSLVDWAHSHIGLVRVQATVLYSNDRSAKVLNKCGFEREGLLRSYRLVRGRAADFWMYSHVISLPKTD